MVRLEIQVWITINEEDGNWGDDPRGLAKQILEDMHVPGLVKAEMVNGISYEWDYEVKGNPWDGA